MNKKIAIGVLCFGDKKSNPERFNVLVKCFKALEKIKKDDIYLFCFDNNSCRDTKKLLKGLDFFDDIFYMDHNYYDFGPMIALNHISKKLNSKYVLFLNDDCLFYKENCIADCMQFLDEHEECGAVKLIKYEHDNSMAYDKIKGSKSPNAQRLYNTVSGAKLRWEGPYNINDSKFYINNWHYHSMPVLCRSEVYDKILPKKDIEPLQTLEGHMMKGYNSLNIKIGVLDGGAFDHMIHPNKADPDKARRHILRRPVISYDKALEELKTLIKF